MPATFANLWLPVIALCATVILGVFYQTHHFDKRLEDLRDTVGELRDAMNRRFDALEKRIERLEERAERPVYRP